MRKNKLWLGMAMFCVLAGMAGLSQADVIFSDDFESHTDVATSWVSNTDNDPGAPPVGAGWTIDESDETGTQVMRSPVSSSGYTFDTPYGQQFMHMWRSGGDQMAWAGLTTDAQNLVTSNGSMRVEVKAQNVSGLDGWGASLNIGAFDSAPGSYNNRAFDISLRSTGEVWLYTGSTVKNTALDAVFDCNTWESLIIDVDFVTDTWSLTIDGVTVGGLGFEGGDLSKIQYVTFGMTDPGRGGIDDVLITTPVPEPATMALLTIGGLGVLIRRKR